MGVKIVSISDLAKDLEGVTVFQDCEDSDINDIFRQECRKIGLSTEEVSLLVPEEYDKYDFNNLFPASASEHYAGGHSVQLNMPFNANERYKMNPLVRFTMALAYPLEDHKGQLRKVIRHELAHIELGHCKIKIPQPFSFLYSAFIADPIVEVYNLLRR